MIYILLPAYNEEKSLQPMFEKLAMLFKNTNDKFKVIACNDASTDGTAFILNKLSKEYPIEIITHKINRGLGETSRDLFEKAAEISSPEDVLIRMDCDNTQNPEFINSMLEKIKQGYDVVISSRFQPGGGQRGVNAYRKFMSYCANIFMRIVFNVHGVRDYSSGYRAYRAVLIQQAINIFGNNFIQLKGLGFTCTLEKLIKLKILGARFAEIPSILRYDQKMSTSKMVSSITTLGYFAIVILYYWPWGGWKRAYRKKLKKDI